MRRDRVDHLIAAARAQTRGGLFVDVRRETEPPAFLLAVANKMIEGIHPGPSDVRVFVEIEIFIKAEGSEPPRRPGDYGP